MRLDSWVEEKLGIEKELTREKLEKYQLKKINYLIQYTKKNSPFYKKIYKDIDKINSLEELSKLPIITKEDILQSGNKMICVSQSEISRIVSLDTSGTTGQYKRIYFTEEDQQLTVDFFEQGLSLLVNKEDIMLVMLPFERENSVGDLIKKSLENIKIKPVLNGVLTSFEESVSIMIDNKVNSIVGMPIDVLALGRYIKANNLKINIKSILLSADMVSNIVVNEIKKVYNCEVFNHFGMTETGLGAAVECGYHDGMHIRENDLLIEIVNPVTKEYVKDNERGEVLITTLTREAMPLIRYATGDISYLLEEKCKCNSVLKQLGNIKCRIDNRVHIGKNLYISINEIDDVLFKLESLINYKIIITNEDNDYTLSLELAFLDEESNKDNKKLEEKTKDLLLKVIKIEKANYMGHLKINIKVLYTKKYISFYKGKRKILS